MSEIRVGVDIGGTFTDLMLIDGDGRVEIGKTLTTADPSQGVEQILVEVLQRIGRDGGAVRNVVHGTTLVTNAIIERKGARTALIATAGFRDSVEIGREHRYDLYDLMLEHPAPLVPRHLRFDVPERTLADGTQLVPLDEARVARLAAELDEAGVEAAAICFLHSYTNPDSENRARKVFNEAAPRLRVSLSSEAAPEIGEFARASTTIANVYVQPLTERYLTELQSRLARLGVGGQLLVMLSGGGTAAPSTCIQHPIRMLESGPAAGALAAAGIGEANGRGAMLSFDMGGTTAKLSVVEGGSPLIANEFEVDRRYRFKKGSGLPIKAPVIEMIEIGAGGGSIARVDSLGLLKAGPDSAGADPGPACYGRGGRLPTVTDADLALGYLDPDFFLGGALRLDKAAAEEALRAEIAEPMGVSAAEAAYGVCRVVDENMANAARVHVIERGKNPLALGVIAFGGAGPVHGYRVAELLGCSELILPYGAGVASAMGLLAAPPAFDFVRPHYGRLDELDWERVTALLEEMEAQGAGLLAESGAGPDQITHARSADIRYVGQGHHISVPIPGGAVTAAHRPAIAADFDRIYQNLYGRPGPPVELEALSWRVTSRGPRPDLPDMGGGSSADPAAARKGERPAYFASPDHPAGRFVPTPVYDRYRLGPGADIRGPAIIEERESTAVIGPGGRVRVNERLDLVVEVGGGGRE